MRREGALGRMSFPSIERVLGHPAEASSLLPTASVNARCKRLEVEPWDLSSFHDHNNVGLAGDSAVVGTHCLSAVITRSDLR